jgi:hypothetical protein
VSIACGDYHALAILGDGSPLMTVHPRSHFANIGDKTFLRAVAMGDQPVHYQWRFNGTNLMGATTPLLRFSGLQQADGGSYDVIATNPRGAVTSQVATITVRIPLDAVAGGQGLFWITAGNAPWTGQTNVTFNGQPTAQSGRITDGQQSSLQAVVSGPGTVTFWWKVSSEQFYDFLNFYIDFSLQAGISGEEDWQSVTVPVPAGPHTLRWTYQKDPNVSVGADAGWLTQVAYTPDLPTFVVQPASQTVSMGDTITLSAAALAKPPITYQWFKDGATLLGATSSSLNISNATRLDSGSYRLAAINPIGTTLSVDATVVVRVPQRFGLPVLLSDGTLALESGDADGGQLGAADLVNFRAQTSTNLIDWAPLGLNLQLTNGALLLIDPGAATNNPARFYRLIEQ